MKKFMSQALCVLTLTLVSFATQASINLPVKVEKLSSIILLSNLPTNKYYNLSCRLEYTDHKIRAPLVSVHLYRNNASRVTVDTNNVPAHAHFPAPYNPCGGSLKISNISFDTYYVEVYDENLNYDNSTGKLIVSNCIAE